MTKEEFQSLKVGDVFICRYNSIRWTVTIPFDSNGLVTARDEYGPIPWEIRNAPQMDLQIKEGS